MKPEQQNIAIAKACGITVIDCTCSSEKKKDATTGKHLLDYCNDLNAMFNAESTLQHYGYYVDELASVMGVARQSISIVGATARHRAEAFLRTLKLWQDDN